MAFVDISHGTLVASTVTTVTLDFAAPSVEVLNRDGADEIYVTVNGDAPTVGGDDCYVLPAAVGALEIPAPDAGDLIDEVKLISASTPTFSVTAHA